MIDELAKALEGPLFTVKLLNRRPASALAQGAEDALSREVKGLLGLAAFLVKAGVGYEKIEVWQDELGYASLNGEAARDLAVRFIIALAERRFLGDVSTG